MSGAAVLEEMTKFDPAAMNHVEVTEKVTLPSVEGNLRFKRILLILKINIFFLFFIRYWDWKEAY